MENLEIHRPLFEKLEKLTQQIDSFKKEKNEVIIIIRKLMNLFDLTATDLALKGNKVSKPAAVKYRNPETGDTWSGRGLAPKWIREHANPDSFLVQNPLDE